MGDTFVNRVGAGGAIQEVTLGITTWTASGSPYVVEARVNVDANALFDLTVAPSAAAPQQPVMAARLADPQHVEISWPNLAGTWDLDSTPALPTTPNWQPTGATPVLVGDRFVVTVGKTNNRQFYRLRQR